MNDVFIKDAGYKRLYECFIELTDTGIQKDEIAKIMKYGEYNNFKLNSMLSNESTSTKAEMIRRISFAEMILFDEKLFLKLVNNGLNVFHGTEIEALNSILNKGILSSSEISEKGIQLNTGEENFSKKIFKNENEKRSFISLTDNLKTSVLYAGFPLDEETEYLKKNYGQKLNSNKTPIIICFNGNDIEQKYNKSLSFVKSTCNEIGVTSSINPSDIKCIITTYDKIEYVKSLSSAYGIDVLGYDRNHTLEKNFIDKGGKFYSILNSGIVVDEKEFERCKDNLKEKLKGNSDIEMNNFSSNTSNVELTTELNNQKNSNVLSNSSSINPNLSTEHMSEDLSMMFASEIKMDLVFDLTEKYNSGVGYVPINENTLITKYNINETVAQRLACEINTMVSEYIKEKEQQKENYTPYVLDGFDEGSKERTSNRR